MRKSDRKLDNQIRIILTDICESALKDIEGFQWLTHIVNYSKFPESLKVVCVFDTNLSLDNYLESNHNDYFQSLVKSEFNKLNIQFKNSSNHVLFDSEENCDKQNNGNWVKRLS